MSHIHPIIAQSIRHWLPPKRNGGDTVTVIHDGVPYTVSYDYSPAEAANNNPDSPTCGPGCDASLEAYEIRLCGHDITEHLAPVVKEAIESRIARQME